MNTPKYHVGQQVECYLVYSDVWVTGTIVSIDPPLHEGEESPYYFVASDNFAIRAAAKSALLFEEKHIRLPQSNINY